MSERKPTQVGWIPMGRGIGSERELVRKLDGLGFAVLRAPASGSRTKLDRPDILAGRKGFCLALEVKTTAKSILYVEKASVAQLLRFSERFGAKAMLAVKFKHKGKGWLLLEPGKLPSTRKGYRIAFKEALKTGKSLESLVAHKLETYLQPS
ncbi:Holliday junction resolvase Hjc [Candidatus Hecatella orcuttiae]|uniref:Holliday junction resolvase Hjc n=1 Tax=Candidatus Hecatella orcuttiae TaxID=1935119 RepID=UPI002867FD21|nr:Holliday junction resolvase Hjc [Candidatus Hecatella orcuttiae]